MFGFGPNQWAQLAIFLVKVGADVGNRVVTNTLTEHLIRISNKDYFNPQGLVVRICTTEALQKLLGMNSDPTTSSWKKLGYSLENIAPHTPIIGGITRRLVTTSSPQVRISSLSLYLLLTYKDPKVIRWLSIHLRCSVGSRPFRVDSCPCRLMYLLQRNPKIC